MEIPSPIDPLTDKPKINSSCLRSRWKARFRRIPRTKLWQKAPGDMSRWADRSRTSRETSSTGSTNLGEVRCTTISPSCIMLEWDDRTKSVAEGKLPWAPTQVNVDVKEQDPKTGEEGSIAAHQNNYTVYNDAIAMETPVKWKELPAPIKPRYLFGTNDQFPVDIVKWEADGSSEPSKAPDGTRTSKSGTTMKRTSRSSRVNGRTAGGT